MREVSAKYVRVGGFVLLALLLFFVGLVMFGSGKMFKKKVYFETYYEASVQGLEVGSKVKFRGVTIGAVESISFVEGDYALGTTLTPDQQRMMRYVRIVFGIDPERYSGLTREMFVRMIASGLRVQMQSQGITGVVFLDLDYYTPDPLLTSADPSLPICWTPKYLYIPSRPTPSLANITQSIEELAGRIHKLDIETTIQQLNALITSLKNGVDDIKFGELSAAVTGAVDTFRKLGDDIRESNIVGSTRETLDGINKFVGSTSETLDGINKFVGSTSETLDGINKFVDSKNRPLDEALESLLRTAAEAELLVNDLRRDPSRLIISKPLPEDEP